ncbi:MAG: zinc-binding dehydrogenase [Anaerolineae bacterium]
MGFAHRQALLSAPHGRRTSRAKDRDSRRYPLSEVPEALRYLEEGPHLGKIVISVVSGEGS